MKYDIIIPSWNQSTYVINCLRSIKEHSSDYRVIFVDNNSLQTELDTILPVLDTLPHLYIKMFQNEGFVKATNEGIRYSGSPYIVLMNNDTEATSGWLDKLVQPLIEHNNVGLSGPLTTTKLSWQGTYRKDLSGYRILDKGMVAFFCTMFKREVFENVGLLDEDFGVGFGDDDNYCDRCFKKGYKMALVQDLIIPHHHRSTFKSLYSTEEIKTMQSDALKLFYKKKNESSTGYNS